MSEESSAYIYEIGGDAKGIVGDVRGGVVNFISTSQSKAEIYNRKLIKGSPYMGLKKFSAEDKDKFFGREGWIAKLSDTLQQSNLLLLLGASGSGKSSLIQAGLIPYLSDEWGGAKLIKVIFVPDRNPYESLVKKICEELPENFKIKAHEIIDRNKLDTLVQLVKKLEKNSHKWIIFIDQFEKLFSPTNTSKLECDKFINSLVQLIKLKYNYVKLIIAMRSDFIDSLTNYPALANPIENSKIRILKNMDELELRLAIAEPAVRNGVTFEKGLVEQIISDFNKQAGSLPLLQYALDLLWEKDRDKGNISNKRLLTIDTYNDLGGVSKALENQTSSIIDNFNDKEKKAVKKIFMELIELINIPDSQRRITPISKKAQLSQFDNNLIIKNTLNKLIEKRLLVINRSIAESRNKPIFTREKQQPSTVEVAHEKLLTSWIFLQNLIEDQEDIIILGNRLTSDAKKWDELRKKNQEKAKDELWSGYKLERVQKLIKEGNFSCLDEESKQFIQTSNKERDRKIRMQKRLSLWKNLFTFGVPIVILIGASLLIIQEQKNIQNLETTFLGTEDPIKMKENLEVFMTRADAYRKEKDKYIQINKDENNEDERIAYYKSNKADINRAFAYYRQLLLETYELQEQLGETPEQTIQDLSNKAEETLADLLITYRIPELRRYLTTKPKPTIGEIKEESSAKDGENQFTKGALKTTYQILMTKSGISADLDGNYLIEDKKEAALLPCKVLLKIDSLWRNATEQRCGWYGGDGIKYGFLGDEDCHELPNRQFIQEPNTLTNIIFHDISKNLRNRMEVCGLKRVLFKKNK